MRRREFIAGLGGSAALVIAASAQQRDGVRHIGVLMPFAEIDPEGQSQLSRFKQSLSELGRAEGRNLRVDVRWASDNLDRMRILAKELVSLEPDLILANTTPVTRALQRETSSIPIVFVIVADPVGDGLVAALPRPGKNITGFISIEAQMGGKLPELLKEIAPSVKRVAIMFNPDTAAGHGAYFVSPFAQATRTLNLELVVAPVRSDVEIEQVISTLGRAPGSGLVVTPDGFMVVHRARIYLWRLVTIYQQYILPRSSLGTAVYLPTAPTDWTSSTEPPPMSIASSVAKSQRIYQFNSRSNLSCP